MTENSIPEGTETQQISLNVYKSGVVCDLSVGIWRGISKLTPEELGLKEVPESFYLGFKRLMKSEYLAPITSIESRATSYLNLHSHRFPIAQSRFVSYISLPAVVAKMRGYEQEFGQVVEEFISLYEERRDEMLTYFRSVFVAMPDITSTELEVLMTRLEAKYPSAASLRSKFYFDFVVFEVSASEFSGIAPTEAADKAQMGIDYRNKLDQKIDTFTESVINRLQKEVLEITGKLSERTKAGGLNLGTVKSFKNWVSRFRELNFIGLNIDGALWDLERKLNETEKSSLGTKDFAQTLEADIASIKEEATKMDKSTVLNKFRRRIEV